MMNKKFENYVEIEAENMRFARIKELNVLKCFKIFMEKSL